MGVFVGILATLLVGIVFPLVFIVMYYRKQKKTVAETSYISDRDIIKHINSNSGKFTTSKEMAAHFGLTKSEMNWRLSALKAVHVFKSYTNGIRSYYQLRRPLPSNMGESYDIYLDENRLFDLFDKHGNVLTLSMILVESGVPLKEATDLLKQLTREKIISKISDYQGDRRYVLAAKYRRDKSTDEVDEQSEMLDLDILNLVENHGGSISIDELAHDTGINEGEARERLELLERRELLKLRLDGNGKPEFSKR